ncbi:MAG: C4-dicarboxylate transporter DcuC [Veillonella sp.]|uniref:C4-dicarboxylate transporter DcuC n=1 Tax=Veillonella sp. TaxID=1926307 RepID=UPI0025F8BEBD|nr:C4-dicarboxylate transporter DcuC [Veillonella sp.]MBS4912594.1 C4-dicarboxylate transporter DcuC [Veillonella sp.]
MIITGIILVILTFWAIVRNYETRVVLMLSGLIMSFIGGNMMSSLAAFSKSLINESLTPIICITMGFSLVLDKTGCSQHLILAITKLLHRVKFIIIPATVILVWLINISLISASGLAAAVGAILIPVLIKLGIKPTMAASTVLLGTWGSSVSPANPFLVQVADLAHGDLMTIIQSFAPKAFISVLVSSLILFAIAKFTKEGIQLNTASASIVEETSETSEKAEKINPLYAIVPLVPIVILILASPAVKLLPTISITNAMLLGTLLCFLVTRPNIKDFSSTFFKGAGDGFANIVCLIAAAAMFIQGMNVLGLTAALIDTMANSPALAKVSATFGPFILAAISGSGNAAVLAFNGAVTPHAASFGLQVADMGAVVQAAGNLGRCMSPVAGVSIICAKMAGVNPMELTKRNAIPCIAAGIVMMLLVL